jgi:UDP-N-acetylmuramoylalanine--D-glutamate ligase
MEIKGKKILIIGMARSGISTAKALHKLGAYIIMNDIKTEDKLKGIISEVEPFINELIIGKHVKKFNDIDLVVLSPGVPIDILPVRTAIKENIEVIGELELAYRLIEGKFIAITGTNGKTTTTSLTGLIFKNADLHSYIVGNIGLPVISKIFDTTEETFLITEVSSFQLETISKFRPKIATILNITPDHLNRHKTMENYIYTKKKVFMNQNKYDHLILNYDNEITRKIGIQLLEINCIYFSRKEKIVNGVYVSDNKIIVNDNNEEIIVINVFDINILGLHNLENVLAAIAIAYYSGISIDVIAKSIKEFNGVEHRIEFVRELNNVKYYNDSKGTNPEATIKAIEAMESEIVLIAGGMDKGSKFDDLVKSFDDKVIELVLFGETSEIIREVAQKNSNCKITVVKNMEEAVRYSHNKASSGEVVLLSPACASWDMYESFEHRGREFKELVNKLSKD